MKKIYLTLLLLFLFSVTYSQDVNTINKEQGVHLIDDINSRTPKSLHISKSTKIDSIDFRIGTWTQKETSQVEGVYLRSYKIFLDSEKKDIYNHLMILQSYMIKRFGQPLWNRLSMWNVPYALQEKQTIWVTSWVTDTHYGFIGVYGSGILENKLLIEIYDREMVEQNQVK